MTAKLATFQAEDKAVFEAGLGGSACIIVDDTGARRAGKATFTMQFRFAALHDLSHRAAQSRLAFFRNVMCGTTRNAINAAALAYMRAASLAHCVLDAHPLQGARQGEFADSAEWMAHLRALSLNQMRVQPDPVRVATESAIWGAIQAEGLLAGTGIVSDDAGLPEIDPRIRVGQHAIVGCAPSGSPTTCCRPTSANAMPLQSRGA